NLAIQASLRLATKNSAYIWIASHLIIAHMHKTISPRFSTAQDESKSVSLPGRGGQRLSQQFLDVVEKHRQVLDAAVVHLRDYELTYDMIMDIQANFLGRDGVRIVERIQHMYMRIALAIHLDDIANVLATYDLLSSRLVTHDRFTAMYSGTTAKTLSSMYSTSFSNCTVRDAFDAVTRCVFATRGGGTVAIAAHAVPCSGRNTTCNHEESAIGLWALMRFLDGAASFTRRPKDLRTDLINICVSPCHIDVRSVIEYNNIHQSELSELKSLTITVALPDIFMARIDDDEEWSMFCPRDTPDLSTLQGSRFEDAYKAYEASGVPRVKIRARDLWYMMLRSLILTGGPSIIFKDNSTGKSNLANNPCQTDLRSGMMDGICQEDDLFPRNHASIELPMFVTQDKSLDLDKLHRATKETVYNLNKILDREGPHLSDIMDQNADYRVIAIGVNGLADVFIALHLPYESLEAADLNIRIAETMYHAALEASCELAEKHGPYDSFSQSPLANGILQFDMWEVSPSDAYDWATLRTRIRTSGVRNALLIGIGAGTTGDRTSGFSGSVDPSTSNVFNDQIVCPWLTQELSELCIWDDDMRDGIIAAKGSVQHLPTIPAHIKAVYRTAWEVDPKTVLKMALDRAPYVCHSQCVSLHIESPNAEQLGNLLMRAWSSGMKTGIHRLHSRFPDPSVSGTSSEDNTDREMSFDDFVLSGSS
ncbi:ribonucleotide reductase, partial [Mycena galericulata]